MVKVHEDIVRIRNGIDYWQCTKCKVGGTYKQMHKSYASNKDTYIECTYTDIKEKIQE